MFYQYQIDFLHVAENNRESQDYLDDKRTHFNGKCQTVFDWLIAGQSLTVLWAANNGVSSLPRRIADLKEKGIIISDKWENGVKVWFFTKDQKIINKGIVNYRKTSS